MKTFKKIWNILFYAIIAAIVVYVIYVISSLERTKPIEGGDVTHVIKDETQEDGRNNTKKDPDPNFQKYVDNIVLKNIVNYTIPYYNIELFEDDDLFRTAYTKATVFTFLSENGNYLIGDLSKIELYNNSKSLVPVYKCFEIGKDNILIIAIVDNDKLDLLKDEKDPLKIKIECVDDSKNYYYAEQNITSGIIEFSNNKVFAGDLFQFAENCYGVRISNADDTTAMLKENLLSNTMNYDFSNSVEIFTFGIDNVIKLEDLSLEYELSDGLKDFDDIKFTISAYKLHSNRIEDYQEEKGLLCNLKIKITGIVNDTSISEDDIEKYKEIIDKATLVYQDVKIPLKNITIKEEQETIIK